MADVRISGKLSIQDKRHGKLRVDFSIDIRAQMIKENIFYLGKTSVEERDMASFIDRERVKIFNEKDKLISNPGEDLIKSLTDMINSSIEVGEYDDQIRQKFKKGKTESLVTAADISAGRHRASPKNKGKDHHWVPKNFSENSKQVPAFRAYDAIGGGVIGTFTSVTDACVAIGDLNYGSVRQCLLGKRSTCEGYSFEFVEPDSEEVKMWIMENKTEAA